MRQTKLPVIIFSFLIALFCTWSIMFIYKSSFLINGIRYYSLFDDAMISMKYSWQFIHGYGLVWNHLDRVEGYTNLLWVIIMALVQIIFEQRFAVLSIQILGIFIILGIAFASVKIAHVAKVVEEKNKNLHTFLILLLIFSYYPLLYWTLMGMETGLLTLSILLAALYMLKLMRLRRLQDGLMMSFFLSLSYLIRPDSFYLAIVILLSSYIYFIVSNKKGENKKIYFGIIAPYMLVILTHMALRKYYYGEIVPNTVMLKVFGMSTWFRIENGYGFIKPFINESLFIIVFAFTSVIHRFSKIKLIFFLLFLSSCFYQIFVGGDSWNYWRFLVPAMPFVFILASAEIVQVGRYILNNNLLKKIKTQLLMPIFCILVTVGVIFGHNNRFLKQMVFKEGIYSVEYNVINTVYALRLKEITKPNATVGVVWAGAIPYYSERDGIDFLGKSDKYIAHLKPDLTIFNSVYGMKTLPGHNKFDLRYSIIFLHPDVIERSDWANQAVGLRPDFKYKPYTYKNISFLIHDKSPNILWDTLKK